MDSHSSTPASKMNRRRLLMGMATAGVAGIAGCNDNVLSGRDDPFDSPEPQGAPADQEGVTWDDLGDLEGELYVTTGRTIDQISPVFDAIDDAYDDFDLEVDYRDGDENARNQIIEAGTEAQADVFYTQSSGSLSMLKQEDLTQQLPDDIASAVDSRYRDGDSQWTGVSGRIRSIQFNTNHWSADELPEDIWEYATDDRFADEISTRPNSGTFRSFLIAMIEEYGEDDVEEWLELLLEEQNIQLHSGGSQQVQEVAADNDNTIGLGNQYYARRHLDNEPEAPLDVTFTTDDPGSLFLVSGSAILAGADAPNLAAEFVRHLLAVDAQDQFVDANGEYPLRDALDSYPEGMPSPEELSPPEFDLNKLADLQQAIDLQEQVGFTV